MADMFADKQLQSAINQIIKSGGKITDEQLWFNNTKNMFHKYPAIKVFSLVEQALEEASDKQWFEHKYPKGFFKETFVFPKKKKSVIKVNLKKSRIRKLINDNLKITDVAKSYGLKIQGKGNMTLCPFHADKNPSLGFDDEKNIFHCFGCNAKGDIIEFERRMKENGISLEK